MRRSRVQERRADDELRVFGLDDRDDRWLALLRAAEAPPGRGRVGPYELLDEVRRGGQGVVYRARCTRTGRIVALKRLGAGSPVSTSGRMRFEREIETLRALAHPNIVSAVSCDLDGEVPMFAMEWVEGQPITAWAAPRRNSRSGVREISALILRVCEALQHAHQRGLIHRDLKPANILVAAGPRTEASLADASPHAPTGGASRDAEPFILDFGLARPTGENGSSCPDVTRTDQFVGTVAYAAPEQLRGQHQEVDTRSDVYSLGVVLYEMLTGARPYAAGENVAVAVEAILAGPPPAPRARNPHVPRDLDAVVRRALAPARSDRYQSADALAADLRNVLAGAPVAARVYGPWEPLLKTLRRHRLATVLGTTLVGLVAMSAVFGLLMAQELAGQRDAARAAQSAEAEARERAELEGRRAETVRAFLESLLSEADPARGGGHDVSVRAALDAASRMLADAPGRDEPSQAALHLALGRTYQNLGASPEAEAHFRTALEACRRAYGDAHGETLTARFELAQVLHATGRSAEARQLTAAAIAPLREAVRAGRLPVGSDCGVIATLLCILGFGDDAEALYASRIEIGRARYGETHAAVADDMAALASVLSGRGKHARALELQRSALASYRQVHGTHHPQVAAALHGLGSMLAFAGEWEAAAATYAEALGMYDALGMRPRAECGRLLYELCGALLRLGRPDEAEGPAREALATYRRIFGEEHLNTAECRARLGRVLERRGAFAEAETHLADALACMRAALPPGHWRAAVLEKDLGACRIGLGCFDEAESLLLAALEGVRGAPHYRRDEVGKTLEQLRRLYAAWQRTADLARIEAELALEAP